MTAVCKVNNQPTTVLNSTLLKLNWPLSKQNIRRIKISWTHLEMLRENMLLIKLLHSWLRLRKSNGVSQSNSTKKPLNFSLMSQQEYYKRTPCFLTLKLQSKYLVTSMVNISIYSDFLTSPGTLEEIKNSYLSAITSTEASKVSRQYAFC